MEGKEKFSAILLDSFFRQPLVGIAVALLTGIGGGYRFPDGLFFLLTLALFAGVFFFLGKDAVLRRPFLACSIAFFLGSILALYDVAGRDAECAKLLSLPAKTELSCRVNPDILIYPMKGNAARYIFPVQDVHVENSDWTLHHLPIQVNWFGTRPEKAAKGTTPKADERWFFSGTVRPTLDHSGLLYAEMNVSERSSHRRAEPDFSSWRGWINIAREEASRRAGIGMEDWPIVPDLNRAILLGCRREIPKSVRRVFSDSGTVHIFAISGMHIVLIATILTMAVSVLRIPRMYWFFAVAPLLIFYTVVTGARPSAVRACIMALFFFAAPLIGRRPNGMSALAATAIVLHLFQPWLIFDVGCRLSFAVMLGLVLFCRPFCTVMESLWGVNALTSRIILLEAAGEKGKVRWTKAFRWVVRFEANVFAVSCAAWLASIPLTAAYFGRFTPGSLLANLVVAPCSFFVVVGGCLGLLCSTWSEFLAACYNNATGFFTSTMMLSARVAASLPGGSFCVEKWSDGAVLAWFLTLLLFAVFLSHRDRTNVLHRLDQ